MMRSVFGSRKEVVGDPGSPRNAYLAYSSLRSLGPVHECHDADCAQGGAEQGQLRRP